MFKSSQFQCSITTSTKRKRRNLNNPLETLTNQSLSKKIRAITQQMKVNNTFEAPKGCRLETRLLGSSQRWSRQTRSQIAQDLTRQKKVRVNAALTQI